MAVELTAAVRLLVRRRPVPLRRSLAATAEPAHFLRTGLTLGTLKGTLIIPVDGSLRVHPLHGRPICTLRVGPCIATLIIPVDGSLRVHSLHGSPIRTLRVGPCIARRAK